MSVASSFGNLLRDGPVHHVYNASSFSASFYHLDRTLSFQSVFAKMPLSVSFRSVVKAAFQYSHLTFFFSSAPVYGGSPPVCSNPQLSCQNTTAVLDTCCFNFPGGQLLQTQFWDTNPPTGPANSWTVHGLWLDFSVPRWVLLTHSSRPDHCDGTYDAYCDPNRQYTNISSIISAAGETALLNYMNTYWKDYQGDDENFWEHEWGKHGTCISTLDPDCYTNYVGQEEVVAYFKKTVDLFKTLDSYCV